MWQWVVIPLHWSALAARFPVTKNTSSQYYYQHSLASKEKLDNEYKFITFPLQIIASSKRKKHNLSVREMQQQDIDLLIRYWFDADKAFLVGMGVDPAKMPEEKTFQSMIAEQLTQIYEEKKSYCIIWLLNDEPVGHTNINKIIFGEEASMHLHLWKPELRKSGYGVAFVGMVLPYFFKNMQLKKLYCEPYALNPGPNKTMKKLGFAFVKEYITTPGWINLEQPVNRWELSESRFNELFT